MSAVAADSLLAIPDKPVTLPGCKCAYCGCDLNRRSATSDHVIARRFVPEGTLGDGFHLQVKSCRPCNDKKAQLEDDISIITMLPDTSGRYVREDERLIRTVARKAKGAVSPATRKLAAQSYNQIAVRVPLGGGVALTYNGIAMPTLDDQRVARLAYYHVQGFCHFRSFNRDRGHGRWLERDKFLMLGQLIDADWGNPRLRSFMEKISTWERTCLMVLADGYFCHVMFKNPDVDLWAWALQWNGRLRVFGLYGEESEREAFCSAMLTPKADLSCGDEVNGFVMRVDTPISDEDDILFNSPSDMDTRPLAPKHWR